MSGTHDNSDIPHELKGKLTAFDSALTTVEKRLQPLLDTPQVELNPTVSPRIRTELITDLDLRF